jgi:hypothetical protein
LSKYTGLSLKNRIFREHGKNHGKTGERLEVVFGSFAIEFETLC